MCQYLLCGDVVVVGLDARVARLAALKALSIVRLCSMTVDRAIDVIYMVRNEQ